MGSRREGDRPNPLAKSSSFLVTGATGFIGQCLMRELVQRFGPEPITAMTAPPADEEAARRIAQLRALGIRVLEADLLKLPRSGLEIPPFEVLIHLAAFAATEETSGPFQVNSDGTRRLLDWLGPALNEKLVIYTGTLASVDRLDPSGPSDEQTPCVPVTPYGRTKLEAEEIVRAKASELGFEYVILRLCTIIGPGFRAGGMFGVFPDLLRKRALATRLNWPGRASFLHVTDLTWLLVTIPGLDSARNETFVTGNGEAVGFDDLLDRMARVLGCPRFRVSLPRFLWGLVHRVSSRAARSMLVPANARLFCWRVAHLCADGLLADPSKLHRMMNFTFRSLDEALLDTYGKPKP